MDWIMAQCVTFFVRLGGFVPFLHKIGIAEYDAWQKGKKLKILMVGYNGSHNTGADVRTSVIVKQVQQIMGRRMLRYPYLHIILIISRYILNLISA